MMIRVLDRFAVVCLVAAAVVVAWRLWAPEPATPNVRIAQWGEVVPIGGGR